MTNKLQITKTQQMCILTLYYKLHHHFRIMPSYYSRGSACLLSARLGGLLSECSSPADRSENSEMSGLCARLRLCVMVTRGVVMVTRGVVMVTRGVVMVTRGVVMVTRGVVMVTRGVSRLPAREAGR